MREQRCEGTSDTSLTKFGKAQATKIARSFADSHIDGIFSSRLHRATQCAKILRQFIPHKIIREERLNDMNLGVWHGKFPEEIEMRFNDVWLQWKNNPLNAVIPEGEHIADIKNRLQAFLSDRYENSLFPKFYLVSTHDIIIRILLSLIEDKPLTAIWEYELNPGSITQIRIYPDKKIVHLNNTGHLYV